MPNPNERTTTVYPSEAAYSFNFPPKPDENSPGEINRKGLAANRSKYTLGFSVKEYRKCLLLNAKVLRAAWKNALKRKDFRAQALYVVKYTQLLELISDFKKCF